MKVLAINGSPRGSKGNTEILIKYFLEGAKEAKAETETIYLNKKNIHSCSGCFSCWTKTPGKCIYNDDMTELFSKVVDADIIVYGTPLYHYTFTGIMKNFIDRNLPLLTGEIVNKGARYYHNLRDDKKHETKYVLISNCGFPGKDNFSGLLETFKVWHGNNNIAGSILIAQGGILNSIESNDYLSKLYRPFIQALKDAGKEVVKGGSITFETQNLLDKEYITPEEYVKGANMSWN